MFEQHRVKSLESFQSGVAFACFLITQQCANCEEGEHSEHAKILELIAQNVTVKAALALAQNKIVEVKDDELN